MNAAAYYRVSSAGQNLDMQQHAVQRAAAARGDVITTTYAEKRSAKTTERPELQRLRQDARAGALPRRLYVYRLDRLTRSGIRDTLEVVEELRRAGVELVSCADGFDLGGPAAEVILAVMAWAAKMERLASEERRAAAREARQAKGLPFGRPRKLALEDKRRQDIEELHRQGYSVRAIAQRVKVKKDTVHRELKRLLSQKSPPESASAS